MESEEEYLPELLIHPTRRQVPHLALQLESEALNFHLAGLPEQPVHVFLLCLVCFHGLH